MRRMWLLFSQFVTVLLALWFVLFTLKPQWPQDWQSVWQKWRAPSVSLNAKGQSTAPLAQPVVGSSMSFRAAVKVAAPSVVSISTSRAADDPAANKDPWFRFFFGEQGENADGEGEAQRAMGSGVIVSEQGYLLTNNHVIDGAEEITVTLPDSRSTRAKVIGSDPDSDLAVLKIDLPRLAAIQWGSSDDLQVGDAVLAIGNPFGVGQTVTSGIVSGLGRNHLGINTFENFIQTDAAINPGNSGGALVDAAGNLLGINTAIYTRSGGSMGIGFAIPASLARQVLDGIVKEGHVTRGWIGVEPQDLNSELAQTFGLPAEMQGVVATGVLHGSPAQAAGLQPGDVITHVGTQVVRNTSDLLTQIAALKPQVAVELGIARQGQPQLLHITPGLRPGNKREAKE